MNRKELFQDFIAKQLNAAQQKAVQHTQGSLLVIAGAGSGKTRVITARIAHLILHHHVPDHTILALTFTNKAAKEMKDRVQGFMNDTIKTFIGTFHAYCLQLLKKYSSYLVHPTFTILDSDDQLALLTSIIKRAGLEKRISAKNLSYQLSIYKNNQNQLLFSDPFFKEVLMMYETEKRTSNCLDFDDLLLEVLKLFKKYPHLVTQHQESIRHILIDEYQDTNTTQHALLSMLCLQDKILMIDSVCAVGDEDQSIYSWRGATVENMLRFQHDFPATHIIKIEQNYRSAQSILDVANSVINQNTQRNPKELWSEKKYTDRVRIIECYSNYQEGDVIAHLAKNLRITQTKGSQAILYRAHYQSRAIEEALLRHSIPYKIIGGIQFYERKEIKDILAYLRIIINPYDKIAFFRIINCPLRGLGDAFQEQFYTFWQQQPLLDFKQCIDAFMQQGLITGMKKTTLEEFAHLFASYTPLDTPSFMIERFIKEISYYNYLLHTFDKQEAESKIDNVKELIRAAKHHEEQGITNIEQFLHEVSLLQQHDKTQEEQAEVVLMTLHSAKGLEFDYVTLCGLEEGVFPSTRSMHNPDALEEERRLFYVGITRAREYLLLTHVRHRYSFGNTNDQLPSRFLAEIFDKLALRFQASQWPENQIRTFFAQWFGTSYQSKSPIITFNAATQTKNDSTGELARFKINKTVNHPKFGTGIIKRIEKKDNQKIYITALFQSGEKTIESSFLQVT